MKKIALSLSFLAVFFFSFASAKSISAYKQALDYLKRKQLVSCDPEEAYNFLQSRFPKTQIKPVFVGEQRIWKDGLDPEFACRLYRLIKDHPEIKIISAYRSVATQAKLCGPRGKKHGCAPPGTSCHQYGLAVDTTHRYSYSKMQSLLLPYKLHLAYSARGHIQCIEHQRASVRDKGGRKGCNFPCSGEGFAVDPHGSYNPNEIANTKSLGGFEAMQQQGLVGESGYAGEDAFKGLPSVLPNTDDYNYNYRGYGSSQDGYKLYPFYDNTEPDNQKVFDTSNTQTNKEIFRPLPDYLNENGYYDSDGGAVQGSKTNTNINTDDGGSAAPSTQGNGDSNSLLNGNSANLDTGDSDKNNFYLPQKASFSTNDSPILKFIMKGASAPVFVHNPSSDLGQDIYNKNLQAVQTKNIQINYKNYSLERKSAFSFKSYFSWVVDATAFSLIPGISAFNVLGLAI